MQDRIINRFYIKVFFVAIFLLLSQQNFATESYVVGGGDVVRITVYEHPDLTTVARISEEGKLTFPLLGEIALGGMTANEAESFVAKHLQNGGFVNNPQVRLIVEQYRSQQVSVLGEVNKPGKYVIERESTIVDLLGMAAGVSAQGADTITVTKISNNKVVQHKIDLIALFQESDLEQNITVSNGDIIFVPRMDRFYIYGEVQRSGAFRLERNMTVMQALAVGGGLTPRGTERGMSIKRIGVDGKVINQAVSLEGKLLPNDVIYIKESLF